MASNFRGVQIFVGKEEECLTAQKLFTKYKGYQTYFCTAVMITPCQAVVLCTELLQAGIPELDTPLYPLLL